MGFMAPNLLKYTYLGTYVFRDVIMGLGAGCAGSVRAQLGSLLESAVPASAAAALQVLLPTDTHPSCQVSVPMPCISFNF